MKLEIDIELLCQTLRASDAESKDCVYIINQLFQNVEPTKEIVKYLTDEIVNKNYEWGFICFNEYIFNHKHLFPEVVGFLESKTLEFFKDSSFRILGQWRLYFKMRGVV